MHSLKICRIYSGTRSASAAFKTSSFGIYSQFLEVPIIFNTSYRTHQPEELALQSSRTLQTLLRAHIKNLPKFHLTPLSASASAKKRPFYTRQLPVISSQ